MQAPEPARDEVLAQLFAELRTDSLARVLPPGANAARWAARRRQHQHRRRLAALASVCGLMFTGGLGAGAAHLALSQRPAPPAAVPAAAAGSGKPDATPSPAPASAPSFSGVAPSAGPSRTPGTQHATAPSARSSPSSSPTYHLTRCHTDQLAASLKTPADPPPSGMAYADLGLTNEAAHPCRMYGYPGMQLLDAAGAGLPTNVVRDGSVAPTLFTLQPGGTGWARLTWSVVPDAGETAPCTPEARSLWITPPDEFTQLTLPVTLNVCHHGEILTGPTHP